MLAFTLALLPLALAAAIPNPTLPCGGNDTNTLPPPNGVYTFSDVQIALRTPSNGNPTFAPEKQYCLHPGGAVEDPSAPSIGLYGGLKVGLVECTYASYRWSIRKDGKGIVVGNGVDPIWAVNAEEVDVDSEVTIREADTSSPNHEFRLVDGQQQIRLGYAEGPLLCLEGNDQDQTVKVALCGTSDTIEQSWVILLLPQPVPRDVASTNPPSPTEPWVQPGDPTYSMPLRCPPPMA